MVAACAAALPASAQHFEFDAPSTVFDVSLSTEALVPSAPQVADFDGDGNLDLAAASWGPGANVVVLRGDGRGGFGPPSFYPVAGPSGGMVAADLDGDGDLDLAVANTGMLWDGTTVTVLLNDGGAGFVRGGVYVAGPGPTGITAADFDGDGDADLAVAHDNLISAGNSWAYLRNLGGGAFAPPVIRTLPSSSSAAASGDLDGDGRPDLVIAGEMHDLSVMLSGSGGFDAPVVHMGSPVIQLDNLPAVALHDVDRDGDADLLYTAERAGSGAFQGPTGHVGLLRNRGDGSFDPLTVIPLVAGRDAGTSLHVADVTGDGWVDLCIGQRSVFGFSIVAGDGSGGFGTAQPYRSGNGLSGAVPADLDGDGDLDITAVSTGSTTVGVHKNPGDGAYPVAQHHDLVPLSWAPCSYGEMRTGDLDGDGVLDVVVGYSENFGSGSNWGLAVALGIGGGQFAPSTFYRAPMMAKTLALGDLDGDGDLDVVWMDDRFPTRLRWRLNRGDGSLDAERAGPGLACEADELRLADVDRDGDLDALVAGCNDEVQVSRRDGGAFAAFAGHEVSNYFDAVEAGDMDNDGTIDLVTNSGIQGWVEVSLGNGDGTFGTPATFQSGFAVTEIALADYDGDGNLDAATLDANSLTMSILLGRGIAGLLKPPRSYRASRAAISVSNFNMLVAGDADGDGDVDLLAGNFGAQDVSFWRNRGDGTFDEHLRLGVNERPFGLALADLDGDSVQDVLVQVERSPARWYYPALITLRGTGGDAWTDLGNALPGAAGPPQLRGTGILQPATPLTLAVHRAAASAPGVLVLGGARVDLPLLGGVLVPRPDVAVPLSTDARGSAFLQQRWPLGVPAGLSLYAQAWLLDASAVAGAAASNGLRGVTP